MKIVKEQFECPIELEEGRVAVLILEKQEKFTDFVSELKEQLSDNDSGWILSDNGEILPFSKKLELIIDPFATDLNQKRVLTKLYSVMEKRVVESEMLNEWRILYSSMLGMVSNVMDNMPYILQCNQEGDVTDLFKQLDVKFETNPENLLEKLIDYICVISEVFGKKVFVLVNIKSYFTKDELKLLYKKMFYEKIYLLLIENHDNNDIIEEERVTIIDKYMCVINKS